MTQSFEEFVYAGPLSLGALVGVGIVMALVMVWLIVRERRGRSLWLTAVLWTCRVVAVVVVLWMLAEPVWRTTIEHERKKAVVILVDTSQSMSVVDVGNEDPHAAHWPEAANVEAGTFQRANRMEKVAATLKNAERSWLRTVEEEAKVIRCRFDEAVYPAGSDWAAVRNVTETESASGTNLSAALARISEAAAADRLQAAFLITDGGHNAGEHPLDKSVMAAGVPVYIVPIGNTRPIRDVVLHHVQAPRSVFQNNTIVFQGIVDAHGCDRENLTIELLENDEVVDTQEYEVPTDTSVRRIAFRRKAEEMGTHEYVVRVQPVPDERTENNNEAAVTVQVTEDKIRVLLADQLARWEFRYLRNLFKRDPRIEFDEVLFQAIESRGSDRTPPALPSDLDGWGDYRVVILGDVLPESLNSQQQELLEQFVDRLGGTLVLIAGEQAMPHAYMGAPLETLLPVEPELLPDAAQEYGYHLMVTSEGRTAPMTQLGEDELASSRIWREQYSGRFAVYDLSPFSQPKPASHVLIRAVPTDEAAVGDSTDRAFLCWQRYGRGRVVYLSAPVTWRLRYRRGDRPHHLFWGQLLQWSVAREITVGSKTVRLSTDKARYTVGDEVVVSVRLSELNGDDVSGAAGRVVVWLDEQIVMSEKLEEIDEMPGAYRAVLKELPEGVLKIAATGTEIDRLLSEEGVIEPVETTVTIDPSDSIEMRNTRCNLPLLKQIAERTAGAVILPTALAETAGQLDLSPEVSKEVRQAPVWPRWTCLWIFLGCLSVEWIIRKMTGMA